MQQIAMEPAHNISLYDVYMILLPLVAAKGRRIPLS
jgi:hypothetical protein